MSYKNSVAAYVKVARAGYPKFTAAVLLLAAVGLYFRVAGGSLTLMLVVTALLFCATAWGLALERSDKFEKRSIVNPLNTSGLVTVANNVLFLAALIATGAYLSDLISAGGPMRVELLKLRDILLFRYSEYLFVTGCVLAATLRVLKRKYLSALILIICAFIWSLYYEPVTTFVNSLGVDSFSELGSFSVREASFWLSTAGGILRPTISSKVLLFYFISAVAATWAVWRVSVSLDLPSRRVAMLGHAAAIAMIAGSIYFTFSGTLSLFFDNSRSFLTTRDNFSNGSELELKKIEERNLSLLVYIGESTSVMNMGIYGYPRNTTPRLSEFEKSKDGLIKFDNVMSTHTHTAWSLLEALSVGFDSNQNFSPINYRKRVSIIDLLDKAGVRPELVSNQGASGTWNQASSLIFGNANRHFSTKSQFFGNMEYHLDRPWDHVLFQERVAPLMASKRGMRDVTFFHSYGGHGKYLENIPPEFRDPIDNFISSRSDSMLTGKLQGHLPNIDAYDSAIRYVDFSVAEAFKSAEKNDRPTVVLYFSDHGDAVFSGRGHDSSAFVHEMARVPFLLYFNAAARGEYGAVFEEFRTLAQQKHISTLASLPNTIFKLLGFQTTATQKKLNFEQTQVGETSTKFPVSLRDLKDGVSYINIDSQEIVAPSALSHPLIDATDYATRYFALKETAGNRSAKICYHGSNTFAKALRGAFVTDCLEADFMVEDSGDLMIYHPPIASTGFRADDFLLVAEGKSVWVDAKNVDSRQNCERLASYFGSQRDRLSDVIVEFPSASQHKLPELRDCSRTLRDNKIGTSYYVPQDLVVECSKVVSAGGEFSTNDSCLRLKDDLSKAASSGLFTDFSFDYEGLAAMDSIPFVKNYALNTWNVMPQNIDKIEANRFHMIILANDDPNSPN